MVTRCIERVASVLSHCSSLSCLLYKPALFAKQATLVQQTRQACPGRQSLSSSEVFGIMLQVLSDLVPSSTKSCTKFCRHALHLSRETSCSFFKTSLSFSKRTRAFRTIRNRERKQETLCLRVSMFNEIEFKQEPRRFYTLFMSTIS